FLQIVAFSKRPAECRFCRREHLGVPSTARAPGSPPGSDPEPCLPQNVARQIRDSLLSLPLCPSSRTLYGYNCYGKETPNKLGKESPGRRSRGSGRGGVWSRR